jgi:D-alanine-D-alanine ligase
MSARNVGPVAVLFGGVSPEHEVSTRSGATVLAALASSGRRVLPVVIAKDGSWSLLDPSRLDPKKAGGFDRAPTDAVFSGDALSAASRLKAEKVEVVYVALHGGAGEDGSIQGFLSVAGFRFNGPGQAACVLAMDKLVLKRLLKAEGLPTAEWIAFEADVYAADPDAAAAAVVAFGRSRGFPLVAKARSLGSSVGVAIVASEADAPSALAAAATGGGGLFVERGLKGPEVSCATFGGGADVLALPAIEILPRKAAWFDYESKYAEGGSLERVPAHVPAEVEGRIREIAIATHRLIGARGVIRTDMIVENGTPYVLETNALPGMTTASLVPQEAAAIGWSFQDLVGRITEEAAARTRAG